MWNSALQHTKEHGWGTKQSRLSEEPSDDRPIGQTPTLKRRFRFFNKRVPVENSAAHACLKFVGKSISDISAESQMSRTKASHAMHAWAFDFLQLTWILPKLGIIQIPGTGSCYVCMIGILLSVENWSKQISEAHVFGETSKLFSVCGSFFQLPWP